MLSVGFFLTSGWYFEVVGWNHGLQELQSSTVIVVNYRFTPLFSTNDYLYDIVI